MSDSRSSTPGKKLRVKVFRDGEPLHEIDVRKDDIIIGRDRTADIQLASQAVSRRHARLLRTEDGWKIEDLGAANGVYVAKDGGQPERVVIKPIRPGDIIVVETFSIKFKEVDDEDPSSLPGMSGFDESSLISKRTQFISMVDVLKSAERGLVPPASGEGAVVSDKSDPAVAVPTWWARLESSSGHQRVFKLTRAKATVGANASCEIQLPSGPAQIALLERAGPTVSLTRLGRWPFPRVVVDGSSVKNALLNDGDSFAIGDLEVSVHTGAHPPKA